MRGVRLHQKVARSGGPGNGSTLDHQSSGWGSAPSPLSISLATTAYGRWSAAQEPEESDEPSV